MTIDPKQFGEMSANVKNLNKSFDEHVGDFKKSQERTDERLETIERFILIISSKWSIIVVIIGFIGTTILIPVIQKFALGLIFEPDAVSQLLTFYSPTLL